MTDLACWPIMTFPTASMWLRQCISASMLADSSTALLNEFPGLKITAVAGDYTNGMYLIKRQPGERVLVLFLGSNIGNYDPDESRALIGSVRASLQPGDALTHHHGANRSASRAGTPA